MTVGVTVTKVSNMQGTFLYSMAWEEWGKPLYLKN